MPAKRKKRPYDKWQEKVKRAQAPPKKQIHPTMCKLTPEIQKNIAAGVMGGDDPHVVAQFEGISYSTFDSYMKRGETELLRMEDPDAEPDEYEKRFAEFYVEVMKADAFSEMRAVKLLMNPKVDPDTGERVDRVELKWAAWWLERRKRERWSPSNDVSIHGPNNGPIEIATQSDESFLAGFTAAELDAITEIFVQRELRIRNEGCAESEPIQVSPDGVVPSGPGPVSG